jgi:hypothetical protein
MRASASEAPDSHIHCYHNKMICTETYSLLSVNTAGLRQLCLMFLVANVLENERILSLNNHLEQYRSNQIGYS